VLSIPLFLTLRRAVSQIRIRSEVTSWIDAQFRADNASISDISLSFTGRRLQVHATVRTRKYLDRSQIDAVEKSMRDRFGPDARLEVDQILVAVGGVSAPPVAPAPSQNAITGGGVRPVQQSPPFDFKTSETSLVHHLQSQFDDLLAASPLRRRAPLRLQMSEAPPSVIVNTTISAPDLVGPQTIELLESQLSSKMTVPIRLHGEVELSGSSYSFSFGATPSARVLSLADRRAIEKLATTVIANPSLRLAISYSVPPSAPADQVPPLVRQISTVLAGSGLKPTQWSIAESTLTEAVGPSQTAAPPSNVSPEPGAGPSLQAHRTAQVRYDCRLIQIF
jgi:hypothetical protein